MNSQDFEREGMSEITTLMASNLGLGILLAACIAGFVCSVVALSLVNRHLRKAKQKMEYDLRQIALKISGEVYAMQVVTRRYPQCDLPATSWSMRFVNLHAILHLLDQYQPSQIVEFGSGLSTIMCAGWLREQGRGKIMSFEHDVNWGQETQRQLKSVDLMQFADVCCVDLKPSPDAVGGCPWYDIQEPLKGVGPIDFVIVDGPPAGVAEARLSRYPALPALLDKLSATALVVLDDANRAGEREIVEKWLAEYPGFNQWTITSLSNLAVLQRA